MNKICIIRTKQDLIDLVESQKSFDVDILELSGLEKIDESVTTFETEFGKVYGLSDIFFPNLEEIYYINPKGSVIGKTKPIFSNSNLKHVVLNCQKVLGNVFLDCKNLETVLLAGTKEMTQKMVSGFGKEITIEIPNSCKLLHLISAIDYRQKINLPVDMSEGYPIAKNNMEITYVCNNHINATCTTNCFYQNYGKETYMQMIAYDPMLYYYLPEKYCTPEFNSIAKLTIAKFYENLANTMQNLTEDKIKKYNQGLHLISQKFESFENPRTVFSKNVNIMLEKTKNPYQK